MLGRAETFRAYKTQILLSIVNSRSLQRSLVVSQEKIIDIWKLLWLGMTDLVSW